MSAPCPESFQSQTHMHLHTAHRLLLQSPFFITENRNDTTCSFIFCLLFVDPASRSRRLSMTCPDGKKKRPRTAFTPAQIQELENEFDRSKYLSVAKRTSLSGRLGLTETQVRYLLRSPGWAISASSSLVIAVNEREMLALVGHSCRSSLRVSPCPLVCQHCSPVVPPLPIVLFQDEGMMCSR